jgi:hypothetical protein
MIFGNLFKPKDLFSAEKKGDAMAIEELVAAGHDVNAMEIGFVREGCAPLHIAVLHDRKEVVKVLSDSARMLMARTTKGTHCFGLP